MLDHPHLYHQAFQTWLFGNFSFNVRDRLNDQGLIQSQNVAISQTNLSL